MQKQKATQIKSYANKHNLYIWKGMGVRGKG